MRFLNDVIEHIKNHPEVDDVQFQSSVPLLGEGEVVLLRVYMKDDKPPDLGVHVRDGLAAKMKIGKLPEKGIGA